MAKEFLPSFGRRQGHKLREPHQRLFETLLPRLRLTPLAKGEFYQADAIVPGSHGLRLELGFGGGEHLAAQARLHPGIGFIGGEPFVNGVASMLAHIQKDGLSNIRVVDDDIRPVMASLPDGCLEGIYVLFPDPWPKRKHFKRRVVQQAFLLEAARLLKPVGFLLLATDHVDYSCWMLEQMAGVKELFAWQAEVMADWHNPPEGWTPTRYEMKTRAEGREPVFLRYVRRE